MVLGKLKPVIDATVVVVDVAVGGINDNADAIDVADVVLGVVAKIM